MGGRAIAESLDGVLRRCREGDTEGFAEAYRLAGRQLYGTALRMLRRPEDAEDAVQDTFISLYRNPPDVPGTHLGAWLHRVLVNHCIDRLRRSRRWGEEGVTETTAPIPAGQAVTRIDIEQAVARLPEHARVVFLLHDVEGYKHREIGEMLGLSVGTTKSQLFRAREMLRRCMVPEAPGAAGTPRRQDRGETRR